MHHILPSNLVVKLHFWQKKTDISKYIMKLPFTKSSTRSPLQVCEKHGNGGSYHLHRSPVPHRFCALERRLWHPRQDSKSKCQSIFICTTKLHDVAFLTCIHMVVSANRATSGYPQVIIHFMFGASLIFTIHFWVPVQPGPARPGRTQKLIRDEPICKWKPRGLVVFFFWRWADSHTGAL